MENCNPNTYNMLSTSSKSKGYSRTTLLVIGVLSLTFISSLMAVTIYLTVQVQQLQRETNWCHSAVNDIIKYYPLNLNNNTNAESVAVSRSKRNAEKERGRAKDGKKKSKKRKSVVDGVHLQPKGLTTRQREDINDKGKFQITLKLNRHLLSMIFEQTITET